MNIRFDNYIIASDEHQIVVSEEKIGRKGKQAGKQASRIRQTILIIRLF